MGSLKKVPPEGGSGGKRGHSGMEHTATTAEYKEAARLKRRQADRIATEEGLDSAER